MTTTIKLLDRNAVSITLWNAMCASVSKNDLLEHFNIEPTGEDTAAEVKITVNGVEVDFTETFVKYVQQFNTGFNAAVEKKAKELIMKDNALQELAHAIEDAEYEIKERIARIMQTED